MSNHQRKLKDYLNKETEYRYPASLIDLIDQLLILNPSKRMTVKQALNHPFFREAPAACDKRDIPIENNECHEFVVRKELKNDLDHKKKLYTFKHNLDQPNEKDLLWSNPHPANTSRFSDENFAKLKNELLSKIDAK